MTKIVGSHRRPGPAYRVLGVAVGACLALTGCGSTTGQRQQGSQPLAKGGPATVSTTPQPRSSTAPDPGSSTQSLSKGTVSPVSMRHPGPLTQPASPPDIIIEGRRPLSPEVVQRLRALHGVSGSELFSMGQFFFEEKPYTFAAVDPGSFRRFTPQGTAATTEVWNRVADGEVAVAPRMRQVQSRQGYLQMGNGEDAPKIHVGAYGALSQSITNPAVTFDAVVNRKWAGALHMQRNNALMLSTGSTAPQRLMKQIRGIVGDSAAVHLLAVNLDIKAVQTAVLTGGSVAAAIGTFTYRILDGGRVEPDPAWVSQYIRSEQMPIIGTVTGNKVMLPQLRSALLEVQQRGLAGKIYQYGGCYVPRFIAGSNTLSFHTYGTAVDLNVPDNQRGTPGKMDRSVVEIFKKWGFNWGGDWHYTDPMHFELARIVKAG